MKFCLASVLDRCQGPGLSGRIAYQIACEYSGSCGWESRGDFSISVSPLHTESSRNGGLQPHVCSPQGKPPQRNVKRYRVFQLSLEVKFSYHYYVPPVRHISKMPVLYFLIKMAKYPQGVSVYVCVFVCGMHVCVFMWICKHLEARR